MNPSNLIIWAIFLGLAWLMFASLTGGDEWLRARLGKSKTNELDERVRKLESRLEQLERQRVP